MTSQATLLRELAEVAEEIEDLRGRFQNDLLFEVYVQSARARYRAIESALDAVVTTQTPDLWVCLDGARFTEGAGPVGPVASFLQTFRTAVRHAASTVLGLVDTGGRFHTDVERAIEFDISQLASGSLRIGLVRSHFVDEEASGELFPGDMWTSRWNRVAADGRLFSQATAALYRAFAVVDAEDEVDKLLQDFGNHGALRLMYHARQMLVTGVEELRISERGGESVAVTAETVTRLRELATRLVEREIYVSGFGEMRELDLTHRNGRLERVRIFDYGSMERLALKIELEANDKQISPLLNSWVRFTGVLKLDEKGRPSRLHVDSLVPAISEEALEL